MSQNQAKSNYKDCSFGNRDSSVKGTRLSVLILAKSQAGRKFEVLKAACLVSIYIYIFSINLIAFYHKCCNLIGYPTRYLFNN